MTIAEMIRARLDAMGLRQSDLRRKLEHVGVTLTRQSVHAWVSGKDCPDDVHLLALWQVFAVPSEEHQLWLEARVRHQRARARRTRPEEEQGTAA
jgi:hypothetical protein